MSFVELERGPQQLRGLARLGRLGASHLAKGGRGGLESVGRGLHLIGIGGFQDRKLSKHRKLALLPVGRLASDDGVLHRVEIPGLGRKRLDAHPRPLVFDRGESFEDRRQSLLRLVGEFLPLFARFLESRLGLDQILEPQDRGEGVIQSGGPGIEHRSELAVRQERAVHLDRARPTHRLEIRLLRTLS